jgi:hypothetical protein
MVSYVPQYLKFSIETVGRHYMIFQLQYVLSFITNTISTHMPNKCDSAWNVMLQKEDVSDSYSYIAYAHHSLGASSHGCDITLY